MSHSASIAVFVFLFLPWTLPFGPLAKDAPLEVETRESMQLPAPSSPPAEGAPGSSEPRKGTPTKSLPTESMTPGAGRPDAIQKTRPAVPPPSRKVPPRTPLSGDSVTTPTARPGVRPQTPAPEGPGLEAPPAITHANESASAHLEIVEMQEIPSGGQRGQVAIVVKAIPEEAGKRPPRDDFPIRLLEGDRVVWEGRGRVTNLIFGWGARVVARYVVPKREISLTAEVNLPGMNRRYPESCPVRVICRGPGDSETMTFNPPSRAGDVPAAVGGSAREIRGAIDRDPDGDYPSRLTRLTVLREAPAWQLLEVGYEGPERHAQHHLTVEVNSSPGDRDIFRCMMTDPGFPVRRLRVPAGRERRRQLVCRLADGVSEPHSGSVRATLTWREAGRTRSQVMRGPVRTWTPGERTAEERPDYTIESARVTYGTSGEPRLLDIRVRNLHDLGTVPVEVEVVFRRRPDMPPIIREYLVPVPGGRGAALLGIGPGSDLRWVVNDVGQSGWLDVTVAPTAGSVETADADYSNNTQRITLSDYHPERP